MVQQDQQSNVHYHSEFNWKRSVLEMYSLIVRIAVITCEAVKNYLAICPGSNSSLPIDKASERQHKRWYYRTAHDVTLVNWKDI